MAIERISIIDRADRLAAELGGYAQSTSQTTPRLFWLEAIELAAVRLGAPAEFAREQRTRLIRFYADGMPAVMALDTLLSFARGAEQASVADAIEPNAAKSALSIEQRGERFSLATRSFCIALEES